MSLAIALCISGVMSHEGFRHKIYKDKNGWSIGNGYSLTSNPLDLPKSTIDRYKKKGISEVEAKQLVTKMCNKTASDLSNNLDWFNKLSYKSQYVMLDMGYNLGVNGLLEFDKTLRYIKNNQVTLASREMLDSKWAKQTKSRATDLSQLLRNNKA